MTQTPGYGATNCPNCGHYLAGRTDVCPTCGFALQPVPMQPNEAPANSQPPGYGPAGGPGGPAGPAGPYPGWGSVPAAGPYPGPYTSWGYVPAPAAASGDSTPIIVALALIGLALIICAGGLFVLGIAGVGGESSRTPARGLPTLITPGLGMRTPDSIPTSGRTLGSPSAPHTLDVWVDFQCPACRDFALDVEPRLVENYVATGQAKIRFHDYIVIDRVSSVGGTESLDAANAALCANDQGKFWTYRDWLFANQVAEGSGAFSKARLKLIARAAAIVDLTGFDSCVDGGEHNAEINAETVPSGATGTPTVVVDGGAPLRSYDYETVSAAIDASPGA